MSRRRKRRKGKKRTRNGKSKVRTDMKDIVVNVPRYKKIMLFSKIIAVFICAVGFELLLQNNIALGILCIVVAIIIIITPIRLKVSAEDDGQDS